MRDHDVTALTTTELDHARRELATSLALIRPGSPAQVPIRVRAGRGERPCAAWRAKAGRRDAARVPGGSETEAGRSHSRRSDQLRFRGLGDADRPATVRARVSRPGVRGHRQRGRRLRCLADRRRVPAPRAPETRRPRKRTGRPQVLRTVSRLMPTEAGADGWPRWRACCSRRPAGSKQRPSAATCGPRPGWSC
jgi:hypothetical protein